VNRNAGTIGRYKYLPGLLRRVRWFQHLASIIAEALILLAFLASGMDISLSGVMANNAVIKWAWAAIFSLGVDTSFVISWVRCRQLGRSWHLLWSIPMALGISFVVFEPVVIQLYQQALDVTFQQALDALGISLPILVHARAGVAVFLGAILALTNGENDADDERVHDEVPVKRAPVRRQRFVWFKRLGRWLRFMLKRLWQWLWAIGQEQPKPAAPVTINQRTPFHVAARQPPDMLLVEPTPPPLRQPVTTEAVAVEQVEVPDEIAETPTQPLVAIEQAVAEQIAPPEQLAETHEQLSEEPAQPTEGTAQSEPPKYDTPEQRAQKVSELDVTGLSPVERVAKVLELFADLSDRELGKLSGMSAATAKKHREALKGTQEREE
jgi:hypothetical protein